MNTLPGDIVAGAQFIVTGASQVTLVSYWNVLQPTVNPVTKEILFPFGDEEAVLVTDFVCVTTIGPSAITLGGAMLFIPGTGIRGSVRPLVGATLANGGFVVVRMSPPFTNANQFPSPIVSN